jgi:hypothetical protein
MTDIEIGFDAGTAKHLENGVGGSRHRAYIDDNGAVCLFCESKSGLGGVAVSVGALDWLGGQQSAERYVRLKNEVSGFDVTVQLEELPKKPPRDGQYGPYVIFDPADFEAPPPFPPRADDRPF